LVFVLGSRACLGDSGGGFALERGENKWFLRGVVSYGEGNEIIKDGKKETVCDTVLPSFYVDLANYMDWITTNVDFSP